MSKFIIKSQLLQRFTKVSNINNYICLQITNGKKYIISTNERIACVQYLGETKDADETLYIKIDSKFLRFLGNEVNMDSEFVVETVPELAIGSIKTVLCDYTDYLKWSGVTTYDNWQKWFKVSESTKGFMYWNLYEIETLFESSPSGNVVFPVNVNNSEPVIVSDVSDSNWLGVFIPLSDNEKPLKPAELPTWL